MGRGRVVRIEGLEAVRAELGPLVVDARLPSFGDPTTDGYEGEGTVVLRHPETAVVEAGLATLISKVRIVLG